MKKYFVKLMVVSALIFAAIVAKKKARAQNTDLRRPDKAGATIADPGGTRTNNPPTPGSGKASQESSTIFVTEIPPGYRDWRLISVAREEGSLDDLRAILGNDTAITAYREATLPFPDGTVISRLAWRYESSEENNEAFGRPQSFVAGPPKNGVQFMVKDSTRYASTGGWGFAQFNDGKAADEAVHNTCFACHQSAAARDFVFTRYAR